MTSPVDKFLDNAISAARDHANDGVNDGAHTRLRLRESLANHGATRRKRFTLIAAVIASLFGSTAFAYWAGWRPPWSKPAAVTESHDDDAHDKVSMRLPETRGSAKRDAIPDAGVELLAPVVVPPPAPVEVTPAPLDVKPVETTHVETKPVETKPVKTKPHPRITRPAPAPTPPPPAQEEVVPTPPPAPPPPVEVTKQPPTVETPKPQPSAEIAAYRNAHNLHFRGSDPKAALVAWDAYLAKYPNGSLALEARYDRALVLVKLARWNEARLALAPFANAKAGSYRQKEAAEILAAIRDR